VEEPLENFRSEETVGQLTAFRELIDHTTSMIADCDPFCTTFFDQSPLFDLWWTFSLFFRRDLY